MVKLLSQELSLTVKANDCRNRVMHVCQKASGTIAEGLTVGIDMGLNLYVDYVGTHMCLGGGALQMFLRWIDAHRELLTDKNFHPENVK